MPSATVQNLPVRPAPQQTATDTDTDTATADLDARIASLQEQISDLTSRRQYLTSTILSSPTLHSLLKRREQEQPSELLRPLTVQLEKHARHLDSNLHRLVFSVTSFPYTDPSPHKSDAEKKLLGVRIDVSRRDGGYEKPFYVLLRRVIGASGQGKGEGEGEVRLVVHRHTIPEFVPVRELERRYLPVPTTDADDDREEEEDEVTALKRPPPSPPQNLHAFAREIRNALVSWHLRVDAVKILQHQLSSSASASASASKLQSIQATSLEHRFLRLEWRDGRVGRVKLGEQGQIERVVVVSADGGREKDVEFAVQRGEDVRVDALLERLNSV